VTDPVQFIDMGWMMGDYNREIFVAHFYNEVRKELIILPLLSFLAELDVTVETVALRSFTLFILPPSCAHMLNWRSFLFRLPFLFSVQSALDISSQTETIPPPRLLLHLAPRLSPFATDTSVFRPSPSTHLSISHAHPLAPSLARSLSPLLLFLHPDWLKWDEWLIEQATRIKKIWADAGRPYKAGQGVDPAISIEKGKHQPEAAAKEKERQKAAGWDV
jgi:hypothetical protein